MTAEDRIVDDPEQVVVRDKRRLDPDSGQVRETAPSSPAAARSADAADRPVAGEVAGSGGEGGPDAGDDRVAELTADLQRLSAEYANYRKRVERDRVAVVEAATAGVLTGLLPVLDDLDRAREHGDLTGAFASVADALVSFTEKLGLERFGEPGEPFDPAVHEALMQAAPDATASVPTCAQVLQAGYRLSGGRVLRPARVAVAEPGQPEPVPAGESGPAES